MNEYLKMPWSMEDTVKNLEEIEQHIVGILKKANVDGMGEKDAAEFAFDFERAMISLKKQIPKPPRLWGDGEWDGEVVYDMYDCPNCGKSYEIDDQYDYCPNCGQAIKWEDGEEDAKTDR